MDPPSYWVALTEMLAERLRMRSPVEYRLVYGFGRPDDARLAAESHRTFFEARGVHSCLQARFLASSAGVDLLIIDHKHLLLALPVLASDPSVRRAILLSHADDLVGDVVSWFDAYIWANSSRSVS